MRTLTIWSKKRSAQKRGGAFSGRAVRQALFSLVAKTIKAIPLIRGKVRVGHAIYRMLARPGEPFETIATLFPERLQFRLNLNCAHERMALLMNEYEAATSTFIAENHQGGTILDIGANIGLIALPLAIKTQANDRTKDMIIALEALPANFAALSFNIRENRLTDRIIPFNCALGDVEGQKVGLQVEGDDETKTGTGNILPESIAFHRVPLVLRTVDGLASEGLLPRPIGFIKIDTDGYDLHVLRGARQVLQEDRPLVFAELSRHCLGWHSIGIDDVVSYAKTVHYELWPKHTGRFAFLEWRAGHRYEIDALLVPKEMKPRLLHLIEHMS